MGQHQGGAAHFVQCVLDFGNPVGRIDVDQDQTRFASCALGHNPFAAIWRPIPMRAPDASPKARRPAGVRD